METVKNATASIARAARHNKFITSVGLREEAVNGQIEGWLNLAAVRACTFSEWTEAMFSAAVDLEMNQQGEPPCAA